MPLPTIRPAMVVGTVCILFKAWHDKRNEGRRMKEHQSSPSLLPRKQSTSIRLRLAVFAAMNILGERFEMLSWYYRKPMKESLKLLPKFKLLEWMRTMKYDTFRSLSSSILFFVTLTSNRRSAAPYLMAYLMPLTTVFNIVHGRFYNIFWNLFLTFPMLELAMGTDTTNPTKEEAKVLNANPVFKGITMCWAPLQAAMITWACWVVGRHKLTRLQLLGLVGTVGLNTGVMGINIAHELIHKRTFLEPILGKFLLSTVCYGHWCTEHLLGHHRHVSTPHDPATARHDETFYSFWLRCVPGTWRSAWRLEGERLAKMGKPVVSASNEILQLGALSTTWALAILRLFGPKAMLFFFGQSTVAFSLLEVVNYVEHFALQRKELPPGAPGSLKSLEKSGQKQYEPVDVIHSWNADARITNGILFKLQRHSDHHAHASRRYQILRSFAQSPQMPTGYAGMITLALIPPLWFKVMGPRVQKFHDEQDRRRAVATAAELGGQADARGRLDSF